MTMFALIGSERTCMSSNTLRHAGGAARPQGCADIAVRHLCIQGSAQAQQNFHGGQPTLLPDSDFAWLTLQAKIAVPFSDTVHP